LSTQISASSRSKRNSKEPVLFEGGDITSKTAKTITKMSHQFNRANAIKDASLKDPLEAVVNITKEGGTSTFFQLTLIQLC
jgi:hypothetical protein